MRSPSSREADPQNRSQPPCGPPKARTRMSRAVAARRVTAAPVAGDGESLDEEPPPFDRLLDLEVELVPPVVVGKGCLRDGDRRRQSDGGPRLPGSSSGACFAGTSGSRPRCRFR